MNEQTNERSEADHEQQLFYYKWAFSAIGFVLGFLVGMALTTLAGHF